MVFIICSRFRGKLLVPPLYSLHQDQGKTVVSPWNIREPSVEERLRLAPNLHVDPKWSFSGADASSWSLAIAKVLREAVDIVVRRLPLNLGVSLNRFSKNLSQIIQAFRVQRYPSIFDFARDWNAMTAALHCDSMVYSESRLASCVLLTLHEMWERAVFPHLSTDMKNFSGSPALSDPRVTWECLSDMLAQNNI